MGTSGYRFTTHTIDQMKERGIADREIILTVETGDLTGVSGDRIIRQRVFTEGYNWLGRDYPHKEVRVVYVVEEDFVIVITVIARYGWWEDAQ